MKRILLGSSCAAAVLSLTAVVGANQATPQTPTQSPVQSGTQGVGAPGARTQEPSSSTSTRAAASALTVTGCIERGVNGEFMLMTASAGASGAIGTSGNSSGSVGGSTSAGAASSTARPSATAAMYRLSGQDVAKYVGQRVEITGTVAPSAPGTASSTSSSGSSSATASADRGGATASASTPDRSASDPNSAAAGVSTDQPRASERAQADPPAAPAGAAASSPRARAAVGTSGAAATAQNLTVTSVKEASGSCNK